MTTKTEPKWTVRNAGHVLLAVCDTREEADRIADEIELEHNTEVGVTQEWNVEESMIGN